MANAQRAGRLAQEIQREVTDLLLKRIQDPRIKDVTITSVDVSGDLQIAKVYYSTLSDKENDRKQVAAGLEAATGLVRRELGQQLTIYKTPEIHFVLDNSIQYGDHIEDLIRKLHQQD